MPEIEIRPAAAADLDLVWPLAFELRTAMARQSPAAQNPGPEVVRRQTEDYLRDGFNLVLLALDGDRPAGFCRGNARTGNDLEPLPGKTLPVRHALRRKLRRRPPASRMRSVYIADIFVLPDYRRQKVGDRLLVELLRRLAVRGGETIYAFVLADNEPVIRLFSRHGLRTETLTMLKPGEITAAPAKNQEGK